MAPIKKLVPKAVKEYLKQLLCRKCGLTYSQMGQDYWVYGEAFNEKHGGIFVDIGAHDGIELNNTYILESRYNWTGICIEANPISFAQLQRNRSATCLNACLDQSEGEVDFVLRDVMGGIVDLDVDNKRVGEGKGHKVLRLKTTSLTRVLEDQGAPDVMDYLSIDVEGAEERVFGGFDFRRYTFKSITIERPTDLLRTRFKDHGYMVLKEVPHFDCFYVHQDFMEEYVSNLFQFYSKNHLAFRWS